MLSFAVGHQLKCWAIRLFSNRTVRQLIVIQWLFCLVWRHQIFTGPQLWSPNSPEWWITKSGYHAGKSVSSANTRCGHLNVKAAPDWHLLVWDAADSHRRSSWPVAQTAQGISGSQQQALLTLTVTMWIVLSLVWLEFQLTSLLLVFDVFRCEY